MHSINEKVKRCTILERNNKELVECGAELFRLRKD